MKDSLLEWFNTKTFPPVRYEPTLYKFKSNPNYLGDWTDTYYDEERRLFNMYINTTYVTRNYTTCTDELPEIKNVIFNDPATIVFWSDGTKTVVKCMEGKEFNTWDGLAMAICKKLFGKSFKRTFRKWCGK